jgi:hypothetical protein
LSGGFLFILLRQKYFFEIIFNHQSPHRFCQLFLSEQIFNKREKSVAVVAGGRRITQSSCIAALKQRQDYVLSICSENPWRFNFFSLNCGGIRF